MFNCNQQLQPFTKFTVIVYTIRVFIQSSGTHYKIEVLNSSLAYYITVQKLGYPIEEYVQKSSKVII